MRRHETVECGGKPPAFQCPECPYKARQRGNLTVHYKRHHQKMGYDEGSQVDWFMQPGSSDLLYPCDSCGRQYRRLISLQRHKRLECGKEAQFQCVICHSKFKHKHSIWHGDQFLQNTFDLDLLGPIKSEPIVPEVLDIVEHHSTTTDAFQPVRAPRGQQSSFKCPNCCRLYMRTSCLKRHLRMECGKAPNYECRICHGRFTYKHNLTAHMKLHVEDPKYKCAYCNKKFYRHDKLVKHMETHKNYD
ncbi:hypothetical protein PV326_012915, partial [Microctonus aethiopoides]